MTGLAIQVDSLGKKYRIGSSRTPSTSLREAMSDTPKWLLSRFAGRAREASEDFWALRDVSFEVGQGEVLGVIGRNGAGKSTLLKLLSQITEPTEGRFRLKGRVASLLEVGTGFHPELTGRENVFLNGAILGMSRAEILRKFDEIVAFAEVERFIDTPVKRYSSGMHLRLGFSVAAHLEPEILIIDEVLAVGDASFQQRCLTKMDRAAKDGRTVLLVSHNMAAITQLCNRAVYLEQGHVRRSGSIEECVRQYLDSVTVSNSHVDLSEYKNPFGHGELDVLDISLVDPVADGFVVAWDQPIEVKVRLRARHPTRDLSVGIGCLTVDGIPLFTVRSADDRPDGLSLAPGEVAEVRVAIDHNLRAGTYLLACGVAAGNYAYYYNPSAVQLEVSEVGTGTYLYRNEGLMNCRARWEW